MDALLQRAQIEVGTDLDRVVLIVKRTMFPMPYAAAFKIAAGLRLASKTAMKLSGEGIKDWRTRSQLDVYTGVPKLSTERRATLVQRFDWSVDVDSEMVYLTLAEQRLGFHFTAALKLAEWLRFGGKKAKLWAGDSSKTMVAAGNLNDAEFNYKRGLNKI